MKTLYQIAPLAGVTYQALSKRVKKNPALLALAIVKNNRLYFDDDGQRAILAAYGVVHQPVHQPVDVLVDEVDEPVDVLVDEVDEPYVKHLEMEVSFLREQLAERESEIQQERNRIHELTMQISDMSKANQVLLITSKRRGGLLSRLFKRDGTQTCV